MPKAEECENLSLLFMDIVLLTFNVFNKTKLHTHQGIDFH